MKRWRIALLGIALALASEAASALTCTSVLAGPWSTPATWLCQPGNVTRVPLVGTDSAVISTNVAVTAATGSVLAITVSAGATLTQNLGTMTTSGALQVIAAGILISGNTLTVGGTTTVDGELRLTAVAKTFTGVVTNNGNWNNTGGV